MIIISFSDEPAGEAPQEKNIEIHSFLGGTGGGISKIAYAKTPFTYRVERWVDEIPPLFLFIREIGIGLEDCLTTFNWGIGFYVFLPGGITLSAIE